MQRSFLSLGGRTSSMNSFPHPEQGTLKVLGRLKCRGFACWGLPCLRCCIMVSLFSFVGQDEYRPESIWRSLFFDKTPQFVCAAGMLQFLQRLALDLADSFPREFKVLSHLLKGMVALLSDPKPHPQDLFFPHVQG